MSDIRWIYSSICGSSAYPSGWAWSITLWRWRYRAKERHCRSCIRWCCISLCIKWLKRGKHRRDGAVVIEGMICGIMCKITIQGGFVVVMVDALEDQISANALRGSARYRARIGLEIDDISLHCLLTSAYVDELRLLWRNS